MKHGVLPVVRLAGGGELGGQQSGPPLKHATRRPLMRGSWHPGRLSPTRTMTCVFFKAEQQWRCLPGLRVHPQSRRESGREFCRRWPRLGGHWGAGGLGEPGPLGRRDISRRQS
jgi:hypothetical protein